MYEQDKWEAREAARKRLGSATDTTTVEFFPVFARETVRVGNDRRATLHARLTLADAGAIETAPLPAADAALADVSVGSICARCRGFCCAAGGDHGFLTTATLRRTAAAGVTGSVVAQYMAHVPPRAYAGSCIFHTAAGCALPRELRSDTCNRYLCTPLTRIATATLDAPARATIAAFTGPAWRRVAIVRGTAARGVRPGIYR